MRTQARTSTLPRVRLVLLAAAWLTSPGQVRAQSAATVEDAPAPKDAKAVAQRHFLRAQELYQQGNYRAAVVELEAAVANDPRAKDLHFNLGVVSERLGRIDEALASFRHYEGLDLTAEERARVEKVVRRLEGAKQQLAAAPAPVFLPAPGGAAIAVPPEKPTYGRLDAATIATGSAAIVALGLGAVFAIRASGEKPRAGFVTGRDGSYADLVARADSAKQLALVADVSFGVGLVAAGAAAWLYFGRTRAVEKPAPAKETRLVPAPLPGGGALLLVGRF